MEGALRARRPPAKAVSLYLCPHLQCNRRLDTSEALSCLRSQLSFAQLDAQVWVRQNKAATLADFQKLRSENVIHDRPHRCAQPHADSTLVRASRRVRIDVFYMWAQRDAPCSPSIMAGMGLLPPILRACPPALRSRMLIYIYAHVERILLLRVVCLSGPIMFLASSVHLGSLCSTALALITAICR